MRTWSKVYNRIINMFRCNVGCSCTEEGCSECYACAVYPEIVLIGSSTPSVVEDTSFTDLGATWTDTLDGTGTITHTSGNVVIATPGVYVLTYTYTNSQGNSVSVIRTVTVTAAP